jgi:hypothetical protein
MLRSRLCLAVVAGAVSAAAGCTMCPQSPEDYTYAAYGGLIQRADMMHGRVGSAFAPAEGIPGEGVPTEIVPGMLHEMDSPWQGPVLMAPEEGAEPLAPPPAAADQSQDAANAFDPGDILSSSPH